MSQESEIMNKEGILNGKPTLVRRVSNMLKDGNYSGPPMLFRNRSMQKIRHCCQNLNLLPYLLYSFDNSKSHPIARKVHICLNRFLHDIIVGILIVYDNLYQSVLRGVHIEEPHAQQAVTESRDFTKPIARINKTKEPKRERRHSFYLIAAIYLMQLLLVGQVITLCSLTIFSKFTPGFIFLFTALLVLGCIALKIAFHQTTIYGAKCKTKKVQ